MPITHSHSDIRTYARGNEIADPIIELKFGVVNDPTPTRIAGDTTSSMDITLVYPDLPLYTN